MYILYKEILYCDGKYKIISTVSGGTFVSGDNKTPLEENVEYDF